MNDVVDKYAVTWVASAGNHGPALCTIGAPPDISKTTIIGKIYDKSMVNTIILLAYPTINDYVLYRSWSLCIT